jgi:hypothetical protein
MFILAVFFGLFKWVSHEAQPWTYVCIQVKVRVLRNPQRHGLESPFWEWSFDFSKGEQALKRALWAHVPKLIAPSLRFACKSIETTNLFIGSSFLLNSAGCCLITLSLHPYYFNTNSSDDFSFKSTFAVIDAAVHSILKVFDWVLKLFWKQVVTEPEYLRIPGY